MSVWPKRTTARMLEGTPRLVGAVLRVPGCALATLPLLRHLRCLHLSLVGSDFLRGPAQGLHHLLESLEDLHIDASHCCLGRTGARSLGRFAACPSLIRCTLVLIDAQLEDADVWPLCRFAGHPRLRDLSVIVSHNRLTAHGAQRLARLLEGPALQRLHLDVADNPGLGDRGIVALTTCAPPPHSLTHLTLGLEHTSLGLPGLQHLVHILLLTHSTLQSVVLGPARETNIRFLFGFRADPVWAATSSRWRVFISWRTHCCRPHDDPRLCDACTCTSRTIQAATAPRHVIGSGSDRPPRTCGPSASCTVPAQTFPVDLDDD